jgi:hypothetical protein
MQYGWNRTLRRFGSRKVFDADGSAMPKRPSAAKVKKVLLAGQEEGEDVSLLEFKAIQYKPRGNAVANDEQLARIAKVPRRELTESHGQDRSSQAS